MKLILSPDLLALNPDFATETKQAKHEKRPSAPRIPYPLPAGDTFPISWFLALPPFTCPEHGDTVRYAMTERGEGKVVFECGCVVKRPLRIKQ